jgi:hypothetical protein
LEYALLVIIKVAKPAAVVRFVIKGRCSYFCSYSFAVLSFISVTYILVVFVWLKSKLKIPITITNVGTRAVNTVISK